MSNFQDYIYTPEFGEEQFGIAKRRLGKEQEKGRKNIKQGFRRSGLRGTGALLDKMADYDQDASQEVQDLMSSLSMENAKLAREERLGGKQIDLQKWLTGQQRAEGALGREQEWKIAKKNRALQRYLGGQQKSMAKKRMFGDALSSVGGAVAGGIGATINPTSYFSKFFKGFLG